jgi:hypothetical protein
MAACRQSLLVAAMSLVSCDRPAIKPDQSLVGAKELPSARELSREIIEINTGFDGFSPGMLSYELRPDNTLEVSLTFRPKYANKKVGPDIFHLPANLAERARQALWRLRPQRLRGVQYETLPPGCPPQPTDTPPDVTVVFIAEGPKLGVEDDQVGVFALPSPRYCSNRRSLDANNVIALVLELFPTSGVAAEYAHERGILFKRYGQSQPPHPRQP